MVLLNVFLFLLQHVGQKCDAFFGAELLFTGVHEDTYRIYLHNFKVSSDCSYVHFKLGSQLGDIKAGALASNGRFYQFIPDLVMPYHVISLVLAAHTITRSIHVVL